MSMSHDEMIAVIQAHRDRKIIQWQRHGWNVWQDRGGAENQPRFNFYEFDYRIKPEPPKPREWWFVKSLGQGERRYGWTRHDVQQEDVDYLEQIHVREVLPDGQ